MSFDKQVSATGYCPAQEQEYTIYGNYIYDGWGHYELGTTFCDFNKNSRNCSLKPCPLRSKLPKTI